MTCQCSDHACSSIADGEFPIVTHQGKVELCKHCYLRGHSWRREVIPPHRRTLERLLSPQAMK